MLQGGSYWAPPSRTARETKFLFFPVENSRSFIKALRTHEAASTVRATLERFRAAGLSWPVPDEMTGAALEAKLFGATAAPRVRDVFDVSPGSAS